MSIPVHQRGFTLIELLVVIGILGLMAAITIPAIGHFKRADATISATRQMLDEVERARQLAISQRSTVYMVFCPSNFWADPAYPVVPNLTTNDMAMATNLYEKQLDGYALVTLRGVGEQPGRITPHYLTQWRSLPEGTFIAMSKFLPRNRTTSIVDYSINYSYLVKGFSVTNVIPFPLETTVTNSSGTYVTLPYLAFNYLGGLASGEDEYIPLARGSVAYARDPTKTAIAVAPTLTEVPPGNSTNNFNIIHIDRLTGRARAEQQEISGQ